MILNKQRHIDFNSSLDCIVDKNDLRRAILWYANKPVARLKHIFLHGNYYAVSIYGHKLHVHRLLMMYWLKRDLETTEYVHHIDGNKFNNLRNNLQVMSASAHQSITNKGRTFSAVHRKRISRANRKRRGMKYKRKSLLS